MPESMEQSSTPTAASADIASQVTAEVLETMFFAEAVPCVCQHAWLNAAIAARLGFEGSHRGQMRLAVSLEAAESVACAFLGDEPLAVTEPVRDQVILELANILCGAILSHLWPESKLTLGAPQMVSSEDLAAEALHCCLELAEGKLAIWILAWEAGGPR